MSKQAVFTLEVDARTFPVTLTSVGEFQTTWDGEWVTSPTKKGLQEKLRKLVRSTGRIKVPATLIETQYSEDEIRVQQVMLTGLHARTHDVLYEDAAGDRGTLAYRGRLHRRLTPQEIQEAQALWLAKRQAEQAWEQWSEAHQANGRELLEKAIAEAERQDNPAEETPTT